MGLHLRRHPEPVDGCFGCKAMNIRIGQVDATEQKRWDKNLSDYASARKQGVQPQGTKPGQIELAMQVSDKRGSAFNANDPWGVKGA